MNINRNYLMKVMLLVSLLILFGLLIYYYFFTKINVYFELNNSSEISLYYSENGGDPNNIPSEKPYKVINKTGSYKIKKGYYIYTTKPINTDYSTLNGSFNTNDSQKLVINPSLSEQKLSQLYQTEQPNIINALNAKYPEQMKIYSLQYGKILLDGSWFSGYLVPQDGSDKLQVILHKDQNNWILSAVPNITISKAQYPEIPQEVLDYVNIRPF